jgi:hypothetical protein
MDTFAVVAIVAIIVCCCLLFLLAGAALKLRKLRSAFDDVSKDYRSSYRNNINSKASDEHEERFDPRVGEWWQDAEEKAEKYEKQYNDEVKRNTLLFNEVKALSKDAKLRAAARHPEEDYLSGGEDDG